MPAAITDTITLVLQDSEKLEASLAALSGASTVFRDMLSVATTTKGKMQLPLDESTEVFGLLLKIVENEAFDLPNYELSLLLVAAVDKYDMKGVRTALLLKCRHLAAAAKNKEATAPEEIQARALVVAAQFGDAVIMADCLEGLKAPGEWSTSFAGLEAYGAIVRAYAKNSGNNWYRISALLAQEYKTGGTRHFKELKDGKRRKLGRAPSGLAAAV